MIYFYEYQVNIETLINLCSEVNAIYPAYAKKIGLLIQKTDVGIQKIDCSALAIFDMVMPAFLINEKVKFFEKMFLLANIISNVFFEMLFLILNNANVRFMERHLP